MEAGDATKSTDGERREETKRKEDLRVYEPLPTTRVMPVALREAAKQHDLFSKPREAYRPASKREASSRGSRELQGHFSPRVVFGHIDTPYRSNEPMYASQAYLRVPMVNIDGGTLSSSSNAGPAEGKV